MRIYLVFPHARRDERPVGNSLRVFEIARNCIKYIKIEIHQDQNDKKFRKKHGKLSEQEKIAGLQIKIQDFE